LLSFSFQVQAFAKKKLIQINSGQIATTTKSQS